jgi:DNA adenine methylase
VPPAGFMTGSRQAPGGVLSSGAMSQSLPRPKPQPSPGKAVQAKPFLKWVGGKRQLLTHLIEHAPKKVKGTYFEPFLGGGALFFALRPERAVLSDSNERLVRTYLGVRDDVENVIGLLETFQHNRPFFEKMRERAIDRGSDAEVAAWFIYLNKTGYNGLYRVNSRNVFNVPFGDYVNPGFRNPELLRACSKALQGVTIQHADFGRTVAEAAKGDFAYFDPPYVPLSKTSSFRSYTSAGFEMKDQERLRDEALRLKKSGVKVLLSNSSAKAVVELYQKRFELIEVQASRAVNSRTSGRGKITELLIK